jgi:ketosteroid isomerase-like protein
MHTDHPAADEQVRLAKAYFARVDAGDPELLGMFTDDVRAYFPKIGTTRGKADLMRLVQALTGAVRRFVHDPQSMFFTQAGDRLVVEGTETGILADGTPWPAGARSEGRYCNVFEFRGPLISRLYIYADPDFAGRYDLFPRV